MMRHGRWVTITVGAALAVPMGCTTYSGTTDGVPTPECRSVDELGPCSSTSPSEQIGTGPLLGLAAGVGIVDGDRLVVGGTDGAMIAVNLLTGDRNLLSGGSTTGTGPAIGWVTQMRIGPDGSYYVGDLSERVFRVDAATGNRTVYFDPAIVSCSLDGMTLRLLPSAGFAFDSSGAFFSVAATEDVSSTSAYSGAAGIVSFPDGVCRAVSIVGFDQGHNSEPTAGNGVAWSQTPVSLQYANGALWVLDSELQNVIRVDPATGARTLWLDGLHDSTAGPSGPWTTGMTVLSDAIWLLPHPGSSPTLIRIDLEATNTTSISFASREAPGAEEWVTGLFPDPHRTLVYVLSGDGIAVLNTLTGQSSWLSA